MIRASLAVLALAAATGAAQATPICLMSGGPGLRIEFGVSVGSPFTEAEQNEFLVMEARRRGIDAETAERTSLECIKVTRLVQGSWVTEYYDPYTWELVY